MKSFGKSHCGIDDIEGEDNLKFTHNILMSYFMELKGLFGYLEWICSEWICSEKVV